jgi:hypothetical protein
MSCFGLIPDIARGWRHNCCRRKYLGREPDGFGFGFGFDWAYGAEALLSVVVSLFAGGRSVSGWRGLKFQVPPRGHRVSVQNDLQVDP